jgi:glutamate decarboxylase
MNETQRIPVVALTLNKKVKKFNEFDVSAKVRERGWVLSAYAMPLDAQEVNRSLTGSNIEVIAAHLH